MPRGSKQRVNVKPRRPEDIRTRTAGNSKGWWGSRGLRPNTGAWFDMCPRGHKLPHRMEDGRCTPWFCLTEQNVAERVVNEMVDSVLASSEVSEEIHGMRAAMRAWQEVHPLPMLPSADNVMLNLDPRAYIKKRLEQIAPLALERRIRTVLHDPTTKGDRAAEELLDRAGFTRKPPPDQGQRQPVVIVNMKAGDPLPWLSPTNGVTVDANHSSDVLPQRLQSVHQADVEQVGTDTVKPGHFWEGVADDEL